MTAMPTEVDLSNVDEFVARRHHLMFDWIREHDPVYWQATSPESGFWSLTRYDDVVAGYREHMALSSAAGSILGGSFRNEGLDTAGNRMLVSSDPPVQRQLRQAVHQAFAPHILARVRTQVRQLVSKAVARAVADGGCDFATDIARELPAGALMAMAAVSYEDAHHVVELTHSSIDYRAPDTQDARPHTEEDERLRLAGIQSAIFEFFADLIRQRRSAPGDDLVGILLRSTINGRPMSEEDVLYNCLNIAVGGNETSTHSASAGLVALLEHPQQYENLLRGPAGLEVALNEILRWTSPNAYDHRVATRDVEIGGQTIAAGDSVALWIVSANRDPRVFAEPQRFDITRSPNRHIAFGSGLHRCVGAQLGLAELTLLYEHLIDEQVQLELVGEPVWMRSNFILGVNELPVRVVSRG
jgi:cytochrome P450